MDAPFFCEFVDGCDIFVVGCELVDLLYGETALLLTFPSIRGGYETLDRVVGVPVADCCLPRFADRTLVEFVQYGSAWPTSFASLTNRVSPGGETSPVVACWCSSVRSAPIVMSQDICKGPNPCGAVI